jgi:hypothetical protein
VTGRPIAEALRAAIATAEATAATQAPTPGLVAIGWATVESDRAIAELSEALGVEASAFRPATNSTVLGSFARRATGLLGATIDLVVVEPSTEGRLAAHLARHGEGPTIAWLADPATIPAGSAGPFGPERLLPPRPDGLLRLLVATAPGTISR